MTAIPATESQLEALFMLQLRAYNLDRLFTAQVQPIPGRKYRYDFACTSKRILVEIQGGTYSKGAHARPLGIARDYLKCNLAQRHGWRIYQFDREMITNGTAVQFIAEEFN